MNMPISAQTQHGLFHVYRPKQRHQLSFNDCFLPIGDKLSDDNRGIKLAESFLGMSWKTIMQNIFARTLVVTARKK